MSLDLRSLCFVCATICTFGCASCAATDSAPDPGETKEASSPVFGSGSTGDRARPTSSTEPPPATSSIVHQAPSPVPGLPPICRGCPDPLFGGTTNGAH